MSQVKYGIVGTGYFGAELARIIHGIEGAVVVAVYDPVNSKDIARELNCAVEKSVASLCKREDIEAIIVASPNAYHKEPVLQAARQKKHVFCEKPIALSYTDCAQMIEATNENNVIFMAGHVMNFMDGVRKAKKLIQDGIIGDVIFCHAERTGWEEPQEHVSWKKKREISGGHLYHHIHELDFIQFIMGPAVRVNMVGGNVAHHGDNYGDEDDLLLITLEFNDNKYATLQYGSAFRFNEHYIKIQGTKGAILLDLQDVKVIVKTAEKEEQFLLHASKEEDEDRSRIYQNLHGGIMYGKPSQAVPMWLDTIMKRELQCFHDVILGATVEEEFAPLFNGTAAKASIATVDSLTLSLNEDRKVNVQEIVERMGMAR